MAYKTQVTPEWNTDRKGRNPSLTGQKHDIWLFVQENPYVTRNDVATKLGMKTSTATARIKELLDDGLLIETPETVKSRFGVSNRTLIVNELYLHKGPRDKVRVEVTLEVDDGGNYHASAKVIGGAKQPQGKPHGVMAKEITLTAPYPNEYLHLFSDELLEKVSPTNTLANAKLIVDN